MLVVRLVVVCVLCVVFVFFFQAEDGIRDLVRSRGLGDVYKRQQPQQDHVLMLYACAAIRTPAHTRTGNEHVFNERKPQAAQRRHVPGRHPDLFLSLIHI